MNHWPIRHAWVTDSPSAGSRVMSYIAFIFILPCPMRAFVEWFLGRMFSGE